MKYPLTPAGIESATFRFVAQHLNHCATAILDELKVVGNNMKDVSYRRLFGEHDHLEDLSRDGMMTVG